MTLPMSSSRWCHRKVLVWDSSVIVDGLVVTPDDIHDARPLVAWRLLRELVARLFGDHVRGVPDRPLLVVLAAVARLVLSVGRGGAEQRF